mgnify:CR=1 FL=1
MNAIPALEDGKRQFYKNLGNEISKSLFNSNREQSFEGLVLLCVVLTNQINLKQNRSGQKDEI